MQIKRSWARPHVVPLPVGIEISELWVLCDTYISDFIAKDEEYVEFEEIHEMFRRGGI